MNLHPPWSQQWAQCGFQSSPPCLPWLLPPCPPPQVIDGGKTSTAAGLCHSVHCGSQKPLFLQLLQASQHFHSPRIVSDAGTSIMPCCNSSTPSTLEHHTMAPSLLRGPITAPSPITASVNLPPEEVGALLTLPADPAWVLPSFTRS